MPRALTFLRPDSVEEAVAMLAEHGDEAKVVAGSTALTIMLRNRLIDPGVLVYIGRLLGLSDIRVDDGVLHLGALATHRDVELSPIVKESIPVVADTFRRVANVRVRNIATVGGVVAEADYASDPPAVFLALDAEIDAQGPDGKRTIPAADFFLSFYTTALEPNEIVTAVRVPVPQPGTHAVYEKFVTRSAEDRPCVGVMASVRRSAGAGGSGGQSDLVDEVRVAVGAASETPQRFPDLEALANGAELTEELARKIADGYAERIDTLDDMRGSAWYRTQMVRVWVRRALLRALAESKA
jgi:carbon-monoxide dehydrogenase medium subunit